MRGFEVEDKADGEAGCAVPAISSSVMASWELMVGRIFHSGKCDKRSVLVLGWAFVGSGCGVDIGVVTVKGGRYARVCTNCLYNAGQKSVRFPTTSWHAHPTTNTTI